MALKKLLLSVFLVLQNPKGKLGFFYISYKECCSWESVAHACNPSYSGESEFEASTGK
jgi:hypothetical protein